MAVLVSAVRCCAWGWGCWATAEPLLLMKTQGLSGQTLSRAVWDSCQTSVPPLEYQGSKDQCDGHKHDGHDDGPGDARRPCGGRGELVGMKSVTISDEGAVRTLMFGCSEESRSARGSFSSPSHTRYLDYILSVTFEAPQCVGVDPWTHCDVCSQREILHFNSLAIISPSQ